MIDFHSHILPGIDDGSESIEETKHMLLAAGEQGVTEMIATPHFYAQRDSVNSFLARRQRAFNAYESIRTRTDLVPEVRMGAEVYYFPGIGKASMISELCVEHTNLLLLEMPFAQWTSAMQKDLQCMIKEQKLTVMLAHIERYYEFQKKKDVWNEVWELPIVFQMNAGSFSNRKKKKIYHLLEQEQCPVVFGSDCHNRERRPPNMAQAHDWICKKKGKDAWKTVDDLGRRLLDNEWK